MTEIETNNLDKIAKDIRNSMVIQPSKFRTYVVVIAVSNDNKKNKLTEIKCTAGIPITGYLYDTKTDSYHIHCFESLSLGYVPVSFKQSIKGVGFNDKFIPMPEKVIQKYLMPIQKKHLQNFKSKYNDVSFEFVQVIDCYEARTN